MLSLLLACTPAPDTGSDTEPAADSATPCGGVDAPCELPDGRYYAFPLDTDAPMPLVVHLHGWNGSPSLYYEDEAVLSAYAALGAMVVMPVGIDQTWTVPHSGIEGSGRDEIAFLSAILDDVHSRWSVDAARVTLSGHSLGAAMAYQAACEMPETFSAMAPTSGGFWDPVPDSCPGTPTPVRHTHGLSDGIWPYEGRLMEKGSASGVQAHTDDNIAFWRAHNGCAEASQTTSDGELSCTRWADCEDSTEVVLCTHSGGHGLVEGWVEDGVGWMLSFE